MIIRNFIGFATTFNRFRTIMTTTIQTRKSEPFTFAVMRKFTIVVALIATLFYRTILITITVTAKKIVRLAINIVASMMTIMKVSIIEIGDITKDWIHNIGINRIII